VGFTVAGTYRCVTIGWLRRYCCTLFGHDDQWERNITDRSFEARCQSCGDIYDRVTDRQVREGKRAPVSA
jgi:hypothetical protein